MKASILLVTLILAAAVVGLAVPASTARGAASPKAEPAGGGRWETIYDEPGLALYAPGERDLVADADGNLHAVYGGSLLYYARKVDGVWQHELVDNSPMAGSGASLAVDAAGRPHICYLVGAYEPELRYARRDQGGWQTETLAPSSVAPGYCSIGTGSDYYPAIAYRAGDDLVLASRGVAGWRSEVLAAGAKPDSVSLLYQSYPFPAGPEVAYVSSGLYHVYKDNTVWRREKVTDKAYSASLGSASGTSMIAYGQDEAVALASRRGGVWRSETVATGSSIYRASLALDAGEPRVAFYQGFSPKRLMYSRHTTEGWQTVDTGSEADSGDEYVTLALASGISVFAECKGCASYLNELARFDTSQLLPGGLQTETIARVHYVRDVQQVAVGNDGRAQLIYSDGASDAPVYARESAEGWLRETIPGATQTNALALDAMNRPHVAFAAGDGVRYGFRDQAGWHMETVKPEPATGAAIAVDQSGAPQVAWTGALGLYVASKGSDQWSAELVHSGRASQPLIALAQEATPHVAYADTGTLLRYGYRFEGAWYRAFPAPLRELAIPSSLILDKQNVTYVGHVRACSHAEGDDKRAPVVAVRAGREWRLEDLHPCADFAGPVDLAIAPGGIVHAAYATSYPYQVHLARRTSGGWEAETLYEALAEQGFRQLGVSLAFDPAGRPTVSYYNPDTLGIRVVRWMETAPTPTPTVTRPPSATCATPTPAPPYTGVPPSSGSVDRQVASCADDTYVRVDTEELLFDVAYVRMGSRDAGAIPYVEGFLFRDVRIPRGADITSARLRVQPEGHYAGTTVQVSIAGELHGQSGDFSPSNWWAHLRPRTVARVPWIVPANVSSAVDSPDIAAILEEIVALPDWNPGNNITILIDPVAGANGWVNWHAYDGKPAAAGQLSVMYE